MILALGRSAVLQEKTNRLTLLWEIAVRDVYGDMTRGAKSDDCHE